MFTDDDLVALKDMLRNAKGSPLSADGIEALIARLEAAENLIELRGIHIPTARISDARKIETAVWAWRKAAGK